MRIICIVLKKIMFENCVSDYWSQNSKNNVFQKRFFLNSLLKMVLSDICTVDIWWIFIKCDAHFDIKNLIQDSFVYVSKSWTWDQKVVIMAVIFVFTYYSLNNVRYGAISRICSNLNRCGDFDFVGHTTRLACHSPGCWPPANSHCPSWHPKLLTTIIPFR